MHPSVKKMQLDYFAAKGMPQVSLSNWHFCDNETDANECAQLVLQGIKRATSPSLWWHHANNEPLPKIGDLNLVTDWAGVAQCIIETQAVEVVPFDQISAEYAHLEGEGDRSLEYWRRVHWQYYHRELQGTEYVPKPDMPIVCETFKVVFR